MEKRFTNDNIRYALEATKILHEPDRRIDTFGTTSFEFHLISELLDNTHEVRVRNGKIEAERPQIVSPNGYEHFLFQGFGEQAEAFEEWLKQHGANLAFLKYGFSFRKSEVTESLIHDSVQKVQEQVLSETYQAGNPLSAVIYGVDDTWEICLLKFTLEMIQKSQEINIFDFKRKGLFKDL